MDFEKKLSRLEEIVQKMEKGDLGLEDSLKLFEEGVKLSRECQTQLGKAEAQVKKLKALKFETAVPMAENIRRALEMLFATHEVTKELSRFREEEFVAPRPRHATE